MVHYLQNLSYWDWLAFATILLILEVFGAGGYLLWMGVAAACVALLNYLMPLPWAWQFILFGMLSIATAVLWWRRQRSAAKPAEQSGLNRRGSELIGRSFQVHEAIQDGRGKIRVGDGLWLARGPDLPAGSTVRVIGQDGVILIVEAQAAAEA